MTFLQILLFIAAFFTLRRCYIFIRDSYHNYKWNKFMAYYNSKGQYYKDAAALSKLTKEEREWEEAIKKLNEANDAMNKAKEKFNRQ